MCACVSFFLRFVALGACAPYTFLWLAHGGHPASTIGAIGALYRAIGTISPTLIGGLADAHGRHREYLIATTFGNAAAVALITVWPRWVAWQAGCLVLSALSDGSSLLDAIIVRCMAWSGATEAAPRCRAFGALGWVIAAPAFGAFNDAFGLAWLIRLYVPLTICALPFCAALPIHRAYGASGAAAQPRAAGTCTGTSTGTSSPAASGRGSSSPSSKAVEGAPEASFNQRIRLALHSRRVLLQLVLTFLVGVQFGVAFTYCFIFLERELSASPMQLALSTTAQASIEMPLFQIAAPLIRRMGILTALLSCMLAAAIRFTGYITQTSVWYVLPFELGHGWSFALVYTATALLGESSNELGLQATVVGLANSAMQLGTCTAVLVWGGFVGAFGLRTAFTIAAGLFAVAAVPLAVPIGRAALWFACNCSCRATFALCRKVLGRGGRRRGLLGSEVRRSDEPAPAVMMMVTPKKASAASASRKRANVTLALDEINWIDESPMQTNESPIA